MSPTLQASGVIPFRQTPPSGDGHLEVLLITSRKTGRWGIPKGALEPGITAQQSALLEAFEEAGVQGRVGDHALGVYMRHSRNILVFPMEVQAISPNWPEEKSRQRRWFALPQAAQAVEEEALRRMILDLERIMNSWGDSGS